VKYPGHRRWFNLEPNTSVDILLGFAGVLYIRKFFPEKFFDIEQQLLTWALNDKTIYRNDDILLSCYLNHKDIPRIIIEGPTVDDHHDFEDALSAEKFRVVYEIWETFDICCKSGLVKTQQLVPITQSVTGPIFLIICVLIVVFLIVVLIRNSW
jgi:hypothetical protein